MTQRPDLFGAVVCQVPLLDMLRYTRYGSGKTWISEYGDPELEATREHPSDVFDYFRARDEIEAAGDMPALLRNYLDKHEALNRTARALTEHGLSFVAATALHRRE
jgi:hypothetical protein